MESNVDYQQALINEIAGLPQETYPNLLEIVRLFKESVRVQSRPAALALHDELDQWDQLSDEALIEFEKGLP